jgi:hypothetical protein
MKLASAALFGAALCLSATSTHGGEPAAPALRHVASGSVVTIELLAEVSTKTVHAGDHFPFKLSAPLIVEDQVVIPAGARGEGEVVDAARPGMAGKPAKLVLAARFVDLDGRRVPLRAFRLSGVGKDNSTTADVVAFAPYVGILALGITGGDVVYPAGVRANAKVAQDLDLPTLGQAPPSPAPPSATAPPSAAASPTAASQDGIKP